MLSAITDCQVRNLSGHPLQLNKKKVHHPKSFNSFRNLRKETLHVPCRQVREKSSKYSACFSCTCTAERVVNLPSVPSPQNRLKQLGQSPKPALGQNFLLDQEVVDDIIKAAEINPGDHVVEIGPGTGVLTRGLLAAGARVTAVEKDTGLAQGLREQYKDFTQLEVITDDFMRWRKKEERLVFPESGESEDEADSSVSGKQAKRVKVVANLPYNITSDLLKRLLPLGDQISELVLMVQYEAAERLISSNAGDGDYRPISVRVNFYSDPRFVRKVDKEVYYPAPAVDGAVVVFKLLKSSEIPQVVPENFFRLVGAAFTSKRKMLRNNLKSVGYAPVQVEEALEMLGMTPTQRPNQLTCEQYLQLQQNLDEIVRR